MNPEGAAGMRALVLPEVQGLQKHTAACRTAGSYPASPWGSTARVALGRRPTRGFVLNRGAKEVPRRR